MKSLLGVEFEYQEDDLKKEEPVKSKDIDFSKIFLPKDLLIQLRDAAEMYSITSLEIGLDELTPQEDKNFSDLTEYFNESFKNYNMTEIQEVLKKVNVDE